MVLCEVLNPDMTPHISNTRVKCMEIMDKTQDQELLFGIVQHASSRPFFGPHWATRQTAS